jgi:transposase
MTKTYRPYSPDQDYLLPVSMREWLPEGHLAYFISDTIAALDLSEIEAVYEKEARGYPPYHPQMMTKVLFYAYCTGVFSSRKIARRLEEDVAFRVLAAENQPDFRTISDFRKRHLAALSALFEQVLLVCRQAGMARLGHIALDGSKVKANASKHKAMSYGRMKEETARLEAEIAALLAQAEQIDTAEDAEYGAELRGDELPQELAFREGRLAKIKQAMQELEAEAAAEQVAAANAGTEKKRRRKQPPPPGVPDEKAQKNFTDPESRIMKAADTSFIQGYNGQAAVDSEHQVIVAAQATNQGADSPQLAAMIEQIEEQLGEVPQEMSLDAGYYSEANVQYLEGKGIDVYMPPCRWKHREWREAQPEPLSAESTTRERMKQKVLTEEGRRRYGLRKETVEPVFGQIKHCLGFERFSLRGEQACHHEWRLICTAHNLLKLFRYGMAAMVRHAEERIASGVDAVCCVAAGGQSAFRLSFLCGHGRF